MDMLNKLFIGLAVLMASQVVFSASNTLADYDSGFYIGLQGGYARINEGSMPENLVNEYYDLLSTQSKSKNINKGKLAARLFIGYSFLPYFSLETGCAYYPGNKYELWGKSDTTGKSGGFNFNTKFSNSQ